VVAAAIGGGIIAMTIIRPDAMMVPDAMTVAEEEVLTTIEGEVEEVAAMMMVAVGEGETDQSTELHLIV